MRIVTRGDAGIFKALQKVEALPGSRHMFADIGYLVRQSAIQAFAKKRDPRTGAAWEPSRWYDDGILMEDSGKLKRSIRIQHHPPFAVEIGTDDPRGALLGEGGTVRPRSAKVLVIPTDRNVAHKVKAAGGWRQAYDDAFFINMKDGVNAILVSRSEGVVGILKNSVTIPGRGYLGVSNDTRTEIRRKFDARMKAIWNVQEGA